MLIAFFVAVVGLVNFSGNRCFFQVCGGLTPVGVTGVIGVVVILVRV